MHYFVQINHVFFLSSSSLIYTYTMQATKTVLVRISPMASIVPPLKLLYTIHHHEHISRMKERLVGSLKPVRCSLKSVYHFLLFHSNPFFIVLVYFVAISLLGFGVLNMFKVKNPQEKPRVIDMFFTAVSSATVSSMSTVEIEVFSNSQLIVITILMLLGGEIFTSLIGLHFKMSKLMNQNRVDLSQPSYEFELASNIGSNTGVVSLVIDQTESNSTGTKDLKYNVMCYLSYVVLGYLVIIHLGGSFALMMYIYFDSSATDILKNKGLNIITFSIFTTISSFSNCGFMPTNENMIPFKKNLGFLLIIMPQSLLGGTIYPSILRFLVWILKKTTTRGEFKYMLEKGNEIGYDHLLPSLNSIMLFMTVLALLSVQFIMICIIEWRNEAFSGLSSIGKLVNYLFLGVNSRHAGESTGDLSTISPAILVLFVFMMYLPPYTTFLPFNDDLIDTRNNKPSKIKKMEIFTRATFSQLSYLIIFVILICITERKKLIEDPLNFNVFNIVFEVISAYGSVGYSIGYSCSRQLKPDHLCKDIWTGFAGRWSDNGKIILIVVMFFGRLNKYSMRNGSAWRLS